MSKRVSRTIEYIENTPMEQLKFKDFAGLKSGWDMYSLFSYDELCLFIESDEKNSLDYEMEGDTVFSAKAIRWFLRGLPLPKAIRKAKIDREIDVYATIAGVI